MSNLGSFKVAELYSSHDYDTPARKVFWDMLINRTYASWDCAAEQYENKGPRGLSGRGSRAILRQIINPKDLDEQIYLKYGERKDLGYKEKEEMLLKSLGGCLTKQFQNKFPLIYSLHTGRRLSQKNSETLLSEVQQDLEFKELNATFKTKKNSSISSSSKTKLLKIATQVSELLEPTNEAERKYVLSLV